MTIGNRVFNEMKKQNFSEGELARRSGVPQPTIHRIVAGDVKSPRHDSIERISKALSVDLTWLITGKEAKQSVIKEITIQDNNVIEIPKFDLEALLPPNFKQPVVSVIVDKEFFTNQGINITSNSKLSIITGIGDSMEGTFNNADPVVVNHDIQKLETDGIYVFTLNNKLYLKRLQILPSCVRMISDNAKYPPYDIKDDELKTLTIHGKVLFVWNGRRV